MDFEELVYGMPQKLRGTSLTVHPAVSDFINHLVMVNRGGPYATGEPQAVAFAHHPSPTPSWAGSPGMPEKER
jgi:hypothetical protein